MRQVLIDVEKKMNSNERKFEGEKLKCKRKREERRKTTNDNYEPIKKFFAFDKSQREKDKNMLFFFLQEKNALSYIKHSRLSFKTLILSDNCIHLFKSDSFITKERKMTKIMFV